MRIFSFSHNPACLADGRQAQLIDYQLSFTPSMLLCKNAKFYPLIQLSMKKHLLSLYHVLCLIVCLQPAMQAQDFKVVGYLPYYRFGFNEQIDYSKLTHLCIAFANPDMQGNLSLSGQDPTAVIVRAHESDVEVFLSLAGGALTPDWAAAWKELIKPPNRPDFIHKILEYTFAYDFQGVDVDLEWSHVDENYSGFVLELKDSLDVYGLPMTAALPGTYRYPEITDEALAAYDWINMMVYDLTGSWAPNNPGPHSPYSFAEDAISYWTVGQQVPPEKLTLGVPFYGYDFSDNTNVVSFTFGSMVSMDPDYAFQDQVGLAYYNGIPTIQQKTQLALDQLSGIMIWELGQDAYGDWSEYSLLNAIDEVINPPVATEAQYLKENLLVYPNPFRDIITLNGLFNGQKHIQIADMYGKPLMTQKAEIIGNQINLNLMDLPAGIYILTVGDDRGEVTRKIVKANK
jgi:chitinase